MSPYVVPAIAALDPTIEATMLCDRKVPLKPKTMDRIREASSASARRPSCWSSTAHGKKLTAGVAAGDDADRPPGDRGVRRADRSCRCAATPTRATRPRESAPAVCASGQHHAIVGPDQRGAVPHDSNVDASAAVTAAGNTFVAAAPQAPTAEQLHVMVGGARENNVPRDAGRNAAATVTAAHCGGGLYMVGGMRDTNALRDARRSRPDVTGGCGGGGVYVVGAQPHEQQGAPCRAGARRATSRPPRAAAACSPSAPDPGCSSRRRAHVRAQGPGLACGPPDCLNPARRRAPRPNARSSACRPSARRRLRRDPGGLPRRLQRTAATTSAGSDDPRAADRQRPRTRCWSPPAAPARRRCRRERSAGADQDDAATLRGGTPPGPIWLGECTFRMLTVAKHRR